MFYKYFRYGIVAVAAFGVGLCFHQLLPAASLAADETPAKVEETTQPPKVETPEKPVSKKDKDKDRKFDDLDFYSYASGYTGIFERSTGRIYLYDTDLNNCIAIRQLNRPGDPMRKIK